MSQTSNTRGMLRNGAEKLTNEIRPSANLSTLPLERLRSAVAISDWLLGGAREIRDPNIILEGLSLKLNDAGVPIDRAISAVELRNSQQASNARIWERLSGAREHLFAHGSNNDEVAENSPVNLAHKNSDWVILDLDEAAAKRYRFAASLREDGFRQHISIPVVLLNGMHNAFTFATKRKGGFSDDDIKVLRQVMPALAGLQEILAMHRVLREVMRMYVGNEPHLRILSGDVRRGEVLRIRAAILFADMRGYTQLTSSMTEEEATALVNEYLRLHRSGNP